MIHLLIQNDVIEAGRDAENFESQGLVRKRAISVLPVNTRYSKKGIQERLILCYPGDDEVFIDFSGGSVS